MKKLSFGDLTPEFLKELYGLTTVEEIIEACKKRDLQVSKEGAEKLQDQFKRAAQLSEESLKNVTGGGKGYSGTRLLLSSISKISEGRTSDCWDDKLSFAYRDDCDYDDCFVDYRPPKPS